MIFNALIIIALIPLALRGVRYRPVGAAALLRRNLLIYGLGGLIVPFIGIKLIDLLLVALHLVWKDDMPCPKILLPLAARPAAAQRADRHHLSARS